MLKKLANKVFQSRTKQEKYPYPDCYQASVDLQLEIEKETEINSQILKLKISDNFVHYVIFIPNRNLIVDPSYKQFQEEYSTPINIEQAPRTIIEKKELYKQKLEDNIIK